MFSDPKIEENYRRAQERADKRRKEAERTYEIPLIITVRATNRDDAEERAEDLADSMGEVFDTNATAIIGRDHNLLDRLGIKYEGVK